MAPENLRGQGCSGEVLAYTVVKIVTEPASLTFRQFAQFVLQLRARADFLLKRRGSRTHPVIQFVQQRAPPSQERHEHNIRNKTERFVPITHLRKTGCEVGDARGSDAENREQYSEIAPDTPDPERDRDQ